MSFTLEEHVALELVALGTTLRRLANIDAAGGASLSPEFVRGAALRVECLGSALLAISGGVGDQAEVRRQVFGSDDVEREVGK